jgi:hypothetical protein
MLVWGLAMRLVAVGWWLGQIALLALQRRAELIADFGGTDARPAGAARRRAAAPAHFRRVNAD